MAVLLLSVLYVVACSVAALAAEEVSEGNVWNRFSVDAGGFLNAVDSEIVFGLKGLGVRVDVEDALGLDASTTVFRAGGFWRYTRNRRHRAEFSWFAIRRGAGATLTEDIVLGDTLFAAGSRVSSSLEFDIIKATYSYSFFQDDRVDMAASFGAFVTPIRFEIAAKLDTEQVFNSSDITAPLPVLGLRTDIVLTSAWYLRSNFEVFYLEIGSFKGGISYLKSAVEYLPHRHVAVGLGLESFRLGVQADGEDYPLVDFRGEFSFQYFGLSLYLKGLW
jgi:hypothetical protein